MKLFTKEIDNKLFDQYQKGSDLENQKVVAKIFNPYGRGTWYLLNSDPQDPDYIWAIVDLFEVEMGSVSRSELESIKVPPFGLGLERDLSFTPINAYELYMGLLNGKKYAEGGGVEEKIRGGIKYVQGQELKWDDIMSFDIATYGEKEAERKAYDYIQENIKYWNGELNEDDFKVRKSNNGKDFKGSWVVMRQFPKYAEGGSVYNFEKYLSKNLINHIGSLDKEQLTKMKKELSDEISRSEKYDKDFKGSNREFSLNKELDLINYRLEEKYEVGGQTSLFEEGGNVAEQNKQMLKNQAKEFMHHSQELNSLVDKTNQVDAWVVAKAERASTDLSDITHYLDGRMMAKGGNVISIKEIEKEYKENENNNLHSENVVLLAENFGTKEELSEAKDILKQHEEQGSLSTELYNRRSVLEDILWKKFQTMKKVVMAKGGGINSSDEVYTIDIIVDGKVLKSKNIRARNQREANEIALDDEYEVTRKFGDHETKVYLAPPKMTKGGKTTFKDKVNAISKRLEGTKVPTRLKKDYGATYDKKEAKQAGQRIAGSMIQKLKMRNKK